MIIYNRERGRKNNKRETMSSMKAKERNKKHWFNFWSRKEWIAGKNNFAGEKKKTDKKT